MPGRAAQNGAARAGPPTRKAVERASATAASDVDDARAAHALGGPAGARVEHVAEAPAVRLEVLLARGARAERGVAQAQEAELLPARAQGQLPRLAAPPAVAAAPRGQEGPRDAAHPQRGGDPVERPALPHRPEARARRRGPRSAPRGPCRRARPCPCRSGPGPRRSPRPAGRRGRRSRNPQQRDERRAGRVEGASGGGVELAAEREQGEEAGARRGRAPSPPAGSGATPRSCRGSHGERGLDRVHLVERRAGGVHVARVRGVEGDLEAAGHGACGGPSPSGRPRGACGSSRPKRARRPMRRGSSLTPGHSDGERSGSNVTLRPGPEAVERALRLAVQLDLRAVAPPRPSPGGGACRSRPAAAGAPFTLSWKMASRAASTFCRPSGDSHREEELDAPVEVARHPVGAREVDLLVAAVPEVEDARVLEEAVHDRDDLDRVARALEARAAGSRSRARRGGSCTPARAAS